MSTENLVFVYGTLKSGFYNHGVMQMANGTLIGPATTVRKHTMYSLGGFPAVCLNPSTSLIYGELYDVEDMKPLDRLEGYPNFYTREVVEVVGPDGETCFTWMYYLNPHRNNPPAEDKIIPDGVWRN